MEHVRRYSGLIRWIALAAIIILAAIFIKSEYERKQVQPDQMGQYAEDILLVDNEAYIFSTHSGERYIAHASENKYRPLPGGDDIKWSETQRCFYYSDGKKIYSCDINGKNKTQVWKAPEGNRVWVSLITDKWILVQVGYGSPNDYYMWSFYVIDPVSLESKQIVPDFTLPTAREFTAGQRDKLYYTTRDGAAGIVDAATGEDTPFPSTNGARDVIFAGQEIIFKDSQYIYRITSSGNHEQLIKIDNILFMEWNGKNLILATKIVHGFRLYTLDHDTKELSVVVDSLVREPFTVDGERYYTIYDGEFISGELYPAT